MTTVTSGRMLVAGHLRMGHLWTSDDDGTSCAHRQPQRVMTAIEREGITIKPAPPGQAPKTATLARAPPPSCPWVDGSACQGEGVSEKVSRNTRENERSTSDQVV